MRLPVAVVALCAILALLVALWWLAGQNASLRAENAALLSNVETRERIDHAIADPRTPADVRERLRNLAGQ